MRRWHVFAGLGMIVLAVVLAIPVLAQPKANDFGPCVGGFLQGAGGRGPVTIDTAAARVSDALTASGYTDLAPKEVMEFSNHFYVAVLEQSTGASAMEVIVERNGFVHPEPGPNMMWNTTYGHMAGVSSMMGWGMMCGPGRMSGPGPWGWADPSQTLPAQAMGKDSMREIASRYLARAFPGATAGEGIAFPGYVTFDVERNAKTVGMLSVHAYTGQVWYHGWHGRFVREKQL